MANVPMTEEEIIRRLQYSTRASPLYVSVGCIKLLDTMPLINSDETNEAYINRLYLWYANVIKFRKEIRMER